MPWRRRNGNAQSRGRRSTPTRVTMTTMTQRHNGAAQWGKVLRHIHMQSPSPTKSCCSVMFHQEKTLQCCMSPSPRGPKVGSKITSNAHMSLHLRKRVMIQTYQLHKLDSMSISMWTKQNIVWVFYYTENTKLEGGASNGDNMPFNIGIQTKW